MEDREFTETSDIEEETPSFSDFELDDDQKSDSPEDMSENGNGEETKLDNAAKSVAAAPADRIPGMSPGKQGFLFIMATLVASGGLGYGILLASGGKLANLINFSGLTQLDQLLAFDKHPTNLLIMIMAGVLLLTLLVASAITRSTKVVREKYVKAETKLELIGQLDLNDIEGWQRKVLRNDRRLAEFLTTTLGSYRLLKNKQIKSVGLEGELRRLELALDKGSRVDLAGEYTDPLIGEIADQILALLNNTGKAQDELASVKERYDNAGDSLINRIRQTLGWNSSTLDKFNVQAVTIERLMNNVNKLSESIRAADIDQKDRNELEKQITNVKAHLAALPSDELDRPLTDAATIIGDLGDRGNKLAFQIAMEVARLGTKGERLLPMTQDLEELTNEFRSMADDLKLKATGQQKVSEVMTQARTYVASLPAGNSQEKSGEDLKQLMVMAGELAPMAQKISGELTELASGFNGQTERLTQLGVDCAQIFDVEFDADNLPVIESNVPENNGLVTEQFDPFQSKTDISENTPFQTEDPFAAAPDSIMGDAQPDQNDLALTTTNVPESPDQENTGLSTDEDRVYDLNEFDAVPIDEQAVGDDTEEDRIYDLSELGAVVLS